MFQVLVFMQPALRVSIRASPTTWNTSAIAENFPTMCLSILWIDESELGWYCRGKNERGGNGVIGYLW
ncbi:hypothetical protein O6P43_023697 [Quillaja saponaria]|uniref:Uncharacterized protein n=1 Tax=Quillaja saponaria TaxID=32244 RepID=A0AAD7PJ14_QUISA|nr:hypothetical protein O6P43_023697 [Quillaja saponaria]